VAVDHLIHAGRRKLAYLKPPNDSIFPHHQRYQGFVAALRHHQIDLNSEYIVECQPEWESSYYAVRKFLSRHPEIEGVICYHDMMAFGAIEACDALGLSIPDQVAVIGFDDITFSSLKRLSLTTFKIPRFEVGVQAARMLFKRMQGITEPSDITIRTEFVQRNSTPSA
jgi:LacI family transcriptional regulator